MNPVQRFTFSTSVYCDRETADELRRVLELAGNSLFSVTTEQASALFTYAAERVVIAAQQERDQVAA